jgi:DNA-binding NtrC family response regulator
MMNKPRILLVDDDEAFLELFVPLASTHNVEVTPLKSPKKVFNIIGKEPIDLIITDVQMPEMSGMELFSALQNLHSDIPVILITAFGSTEQAIQAVKQGAFHYFEKPIFDKLDLFWTTVREALAKRQMQKEIAALQQEKFLQTRGNIPIIGRSAAMRKVQKSIKDVAPLPVTVLITGETGTGKELVARAIHDLSDRRDKPFFAVSCSELASGSLGSELFGQERGPFGSSSRAKRGLFEIAHQGTLFMDEIAEATPALQSTLLRVVETKSFLRVGGTATIDSDFRLIVSSNRNLEEEVMGGRFRHDLYYRLSVYVIDVPPLRNRKDDIPLIADFYVKRFSEMFHRKVTGITVNAMLALKQYSWPGNVRELVNVIERAVITCKEGKISTQNLPFNGTEKYEDVSDLNLKDAERLIIEMALSRTVNNRTRAAKLLGISRKTLIEKLKLYRMQDNVEG